MKKTLLLLNIFLFSIGLNMAFAQVPAYVPTNGLVGWWPFNGNANDESGNGHNASLVGATLTSDRFGALNKACFFNGINQYGILNNTGNTNFSNGVTFSTWMLANDTRLAGLVSREFISTVDEGFRLNTRSTGAIWFENGYLGGGGPWTCQIGGITPNSYFNTTSWYHIVGTHDQNSVKLYVNGLLVDSTSVCVNILSMLNNSPDIEIGRTFIFPTQIEWFYGVLDDIAIYNRALTQQEITNLYTNTATPTCSIIPTNPTLCAGDSATLTASTSATNVSICSGNDLPGTLQNGLVGYWPFCGNANDASGNGNNGTVNGATLTTDRFGNANSAYSFDGAPLTNITMNISQNIEKITLSSWINYDILSTWYPQIAAFFSSNSSVGQIGCLAFLGDASVYLNSGITGFLQSYPNYLQSNNSVSSGAWHHLVVVYSASINNHSIYIDGQLNVSGNATSILPLINGYKMTIGNSIDGWNGLVEYGEMAFNGKIDDIAIWNRALSASEIQQLYTQGQTTYAWSNGATTPSITVAPTSTTTYTCTATVNGASGSSTSTVTVNPLPTMNAGADVALCSGNTTTLSASGATTYSWNNSVSNGVAFSPAATGTYTVSGTDANGCVNTDNVVVTVNPLPTVSAGFDQMICAGTPITLNGSGATTYSWNNGVSNGVAFSPAASNTYTVTGTNSNGCTNSDAVFVMVHALPTVNAGADQSVCAGTAVTLSATGASTYAWNNNVSNGTAFTPTATTTYSVSGTDGNGCSNTDQVIVTVNPLPNVNAGVDQSICKGEAVTLSGAGASSYAWNNNVTNGVAFNPIATATYSVSGTDANGCSNSDEVVVTVNEATASTLTESAMDSYTLNGQTYTQSGTYTQVITNAAGCDSTITLNLTLSFTGLNELAQGIQLYPNPANDVLNIQSSSALTGEYTLYNASGREVLRGTFTGALTKIDVRNIAPGTYTLQAAELMERVVVLRK
jgi:hypothetical protein